MPTTIDTKLTFAQHNKLDEIAEEDTGAKVTGWDYQGHGPKVVHSDGRIRVINPHGRPLPRTVEERELRRAA